MTPERWERVKVLFDQASSLPAWARPSALARECGADSRLRAEVERLLVYHEAEEAIFDRIQSRLPRLMRTK